MKAQTAQKPVTLVNPTGVVGYDAEHSETAKLCIGRQEKTHAC